jgi:hypothetical protein
MGLACDVRPICLLFPVFLWTYEFFVQKTSLHLSCCKVIFFSITMLVGIMPVTIRNLITLHQFILASTNGGVNLWQSTKVDRFKRNKRNISCFHSSRHTASCSYGRIFEYYRLLGLDGHLLSGPSERYSRIFTDFEADCPSSYLHHLQHSTFLLFSCLGQVPLSNDALFRHSIRDWSCIFISETSLGRLERILFAKLFVYTVTAGSRLFSESIHRVDGVFRTSFDKLYGKADDTTLNFLNLVQTRLQFYSCFLKRLR